MRWEWGFGEVILIIFALYELWSLRKYKAQDARAREIERSKKLQAKASSDGPGR